MFCTMNKPGLKFYAVPSPPQYSDLRSRSKTLISPAFAKPLMDLIHVEHEWTYMIVKCFRKENAISGETSCPVTGFI